MVCSVRELHFYASIFTTQLEKATWRISIFFAMWYCSFFFNLTFMLWWLKDKKEDNGNLILRNNKWGKFISGSSWALNTLSYKLQCVHVCIISFEMSNMWNVWFVFFFVLLMQQCNLTFAAKTHFLHIFKLKETCGLFLFIYFLPNNPSSEIKSKY